MPIIVDNYSSIYFKQNGMMKKALFLIIFLPLAAASFAQEISNRFIFIEGTATNRDHLDYFLKNFAMEATGAGYVATEKKSDAPHTLRFKVSPDPEAPGEFVINISVVKNDNNAELVNFDFYFADIEVMNTFNRTLFLNATVNIPLPIITDEFLASVQVGSDKWKNKWIYFRMSFDYPITLYQLYDERLVGGVALYNELQTLFDPQEHKINAMPGATVGLEFQLLKFLSLELNYQVSMEYTRAGNGDMGEGKKLFINMAAAGELKFPIKFKNKLRNVYFAPYGAFFYPLRTSSDFVKYNPEKDDWEHAFPLFAIGGGIQFCSNGGKHGAFFVDAKFLLSPTFKGKFLKNETYMKNPWLDFEDGDQQYTPNPPDIRYKRMYVGIGIGYKIGFVDRKDKKEKEERKKK